MNDRPGNSFRLNTRSASPSPVHKKQPTSYLRGKKKYVTFNKDRNKTKKGYGYVSKKDNKKSL